MLRVTGPVTSSIRNPDPLPWAEADRGNDLRPLTPSLLPIRWGENSPNTHFALCPREPERRLQAAAGG